MSTDLEAVISAELAAELEKMFFWWEPVASPQRSRARILAQAMDLASFDNVRRLDPMSALIILSN